MGFDLRQTATGGIQFLDEASSAFGSVHMVLAFTANRAPTNTQTVGTLPANARIIDMKVLVPVVSNAATTATVSLGIAGGSTTAFSSAQDVKTATGNFAQAPTAAWALSPASQSISCTYTETGTASSAGVIQVSITYCVV